MRGPRRRGEAADDLLPHPIEHGRGDPVGAYGHQSRIPVRDAQAAQSLHGEMFGDRPGELIPLAFHPGEPGPTELLGAFSELVHILAGEGAATFHGNAADTSAILLGRGEKWYGERAHE